jgi:hypothetical protein
MRLAKWKMRKNAEKQADFEASLPLCHIAKLAPESIVWEDVCQKNCGAAGPKVRTSPNPSAWISVVSEKRSRELFSDISM